MPRTPWLLCAAFQTGPRGPRHYKRDAGTTVQTVGAPPRGTTVGMSTKRSITPTPKNVTVQTAETPPRSTTHGMSSKRSATPTPKMHPRAEAPRHEN